MLLRYFPCIKKFGLPSSASCLIETSTTKNALLWYRAVHLSFEVFNDVHINKLHLRLRLGFVHPLQDVALHQCLPLSSVIVVCLLLS